MIQDDRFKHLFSLNASNQIYRILSTQIGVVDIVDITNDNTDLERREAQVGLSW